jgi:hypothetical protein
MSNKLIFLIYIYSEATACMRQLMCTAVSQLSSDQLVPLHHHAHCMYPACLFFLIHTMQVLLYPCLHHVIVMNSSEAAA